MHGGQVQLLHLKACIVDLYQLGSRRNQVQRYIRQLSYYFRGYDVLSLTNNLGTRHLLRLWERPSEEFFAWGAGAPPSARLCAAADR